MIHDVDSEVLAIFTDISLRLAPQVDAFNASANSTMQFCSVYGFEKI